MQTRDRGASAAPSLRRPSERPRCVPRSAVALTALLLIAGCARSGPVDIAMVSAHEEPVRFAFVPQYVDLRHTELGWQRVPLATSAARMELLEYGHEVHLATSHLPSGGYTAIRVAYLVPGEPGPVAEATLGRKELADDGSQVRRTCRTLGDVTLQQHEVTLRRSFCVSPGGEDQQLTLQVLRAHSQRPEDGLSLSISRTPRC